MGKNRDRESLMRVLVNTIVHKIVVTHTNKPESTNFLISEIIEYKSQVDKKAENFNWNNADLFYIKNKSLEKIKEKLSTKYSDINYSEEEIIKELNFLIDKLKTNKYS